MDRMTSGIQGHGDAQNTAAFQERAKELLQIVIENKAAFLYQYRKSKGSPILRFLHKVRVSEILFHEGHPCWEWIGCISKETG